MISKGEVDYPVLYNLDCPPMLQSVYFCRYVGGASVLFATLRITLYLYMLPRLIILFPYSSLMPALLPIVCNFVTVYRILHDQIFRFANFLGVVGML